jgi:hypothetical protein
LKTVVNFISNVSRNKQYMKYLQYLSIYDISMVNDVPKYLIIVGSIFNYLLYTKNLQII